MLRVAPFDPVCVCVYVDKKKAHLYAVYVSQIYRDQSRAVGDIENYELMGINQFGLLHMFRKLVSSRGALWVGMRMDR